MTKALVSSKLDEILIIVESLRGQTKNNVLPDDVKGKVLNLCMAAVDEIGRQRNALANASDQEIQKSLANLEDLKKNLNKIAFLVGSTCSALQPEIKQSSFADRYVKELKRIGTNLSDMFRDDQQTRKDKIYTCMKSVVDSCIGAITGAWQGMRKGYLENEGFLNSAWGMVKEGTKGSFMGAASSAADAFMSDRKRAEKGISELKKAHEKELLLLLLNQPIGNESSPNFTANKARIAVIEEEKRYLADLERQLSTTPDTDSKTICNLSSSVRNLTFVSAGSALLSTSLEIIHDFGQQQKFAGKSGQEVLQQIGTNAVRAVKNYNELMDDSSRSMPSKLCSLAKAFANGIAGGVKGMLGGFKEGFDHGKGFVDTLKTTYKGSLIGSIAGFNQEYTSSIEKERNKSSAEPTPALIDKKPEPENENPSHGFGYS
jgi:hypothetical protein